MFSHLHNFLEKPQLKIINFQIEIIDILDPTKEIRHSTL